MALLLGIFLGNDTHVVRSSSLWNRQTFSFALELSFAALNEVDERCGAVIAVSRGYWLDEIFISFSLGYPKSHFAVWTMMIVTEGNLKLVENSLFPI